MFQNAWPCIIFEDRYGILSTIERYLKTIFHSCPAFLLYGNQYDIRSDAPFGGGWACETCAPTIA